MSEEIRKKAVAARKKSASSNVKKDSQPFVRRQWQPDWWRVGVFAAALAVRLIYLMHSRHVPFFDAPIIDAEMYDQRAMDMLTTGVAERTFYQAPFYSAFLAVIYLIFGHNYFIPRLIQAVLGALSCVFAQVIGQKVFGRREGIIAGFAAGFYGPLVFYEGDLLREVLVVFLAMSSLACMIEWSGRKKIWWAASAGLLAGLAAITRENILLFIPLAAVYMWVRSESRRWLTPALFILFFTLPLIPVTIRNYRSSGDFVPVSSQGGMNFYIGNSADTWRLQSLQPGIEWDKMAFAPRRDIGDTASPNEYSRWFFRKSFEDISEAPLAWFRTLIKKFYLFFYAEELDPNTDLNLYREYSWLLRILVFRAGPVWIPFGVVVPLFLIGVAGRRLNLDKALLLSFVFAYAVSLSLFHVRARYRLPVVPVLLLFSAAGVMWLVEKRRSREFKKIAVWLAVAISAGVIFNLPLVDTAFARTFPTHYFLGKTWATKGDDRRAVAEFEKALNIYPDYAELHHDYAQALFRIGRNADGMREIEKARDLAPDCAFIRKNIGQILRKRSDALEMEAAGLLREQDPVKNTEGAMKHEEAQRLLRHAIAEYAAAKKADPFDLSIVYDISFLYDQAGEKDKFRTELKEYVERARNRPEEKYWVARAEAMLYGRTQTQPTSATATHPGSSGAGSDTDYLDRAQMYLKAGAYDRAVAELQSALSANPDSSDALSLLGNVYKKSGRPADAEKAYLKAIEINPDNALAQNNLANMYRDSGKFEEARQHYEEALRIAPENQVIKKNMMMLEEMVKK
jgi:tetratricopeptide (TPR) repeat protein